MLTKDVSAELEQAMEKITAQGKQPTVALVKANITSKVPMPAIIAAIKSWKGSQQVPKIEVADSPEADYKSQIARLEEQVAELTKRIEALEAKK